MINSFCMKFSLILPVYNVEDYLGKCIESCLNQNLPHAEYEIIVVVDGSPDRSIDIARHYQREHPNIKIIERDNGGLSAARNTGLAHAVGEYVWFIDSDDYIELNVLAQIYNILSEKELEALWLDWRCLDEAGKVLPDYSPHCHKKDFSVMSGIDFMSKVLNNYLFAWSFIYKRSFLVENGLRFTEGLYYEDSDFAFRSLPMLKRIRYFGKVSYNYLQRETSIMHTINMDKLNSILGNCDTFYMASVSCPPPIKRFYHLCFSSFYLFAIKEVLKSHNDEYKKVLLWHGITQKYGRVRLVGNIKTKIMAVCLNLCGLKFCIKLSFLF